MEYNKKIAEDLAEQLIDVLNRIRERIRKGPETGPLVDDTCERLGRIHSELVTTLRN